MALHTQAASSSSNEPVNFLHPDTFTAGLRNHLEATVVTARYEPWDFRGKAKASTMGNRQLSGHKLALHLVLDDCSDGGKAEDVYWPGCAIEDAIPSDDGTNITFIAQRRGFPKDSELAQGVSQFIECGAVAKDDLTTDPTVFVGKRCLFERLSVLWAKDTGTGKNPPDNLMPVKFIEDVGAGSGKKAKASAGGKTSSKKQDEDEPGDDVDAELTELFVKLTREVLDDLPAKTKKISREDLGSEVLALALSSYKKDIDAKTRKALGAMFDDDAALEANVKPRSWKWEYDSDSGELSRT